MGNYEGNKKDFARSRAVEAKHERQDQKADFERAQMERMAKRKFSIWAVGQGLKTFFRMNDKSKVSCFQVSLTTSLSLEEIWQRMEKGFGDL